MTSQKRLWIETLIAALLLVWTLAASHYLVGLGVLISGLVG